MVLGAEAAADLAARTVGEIDGRHVGGAAAGQPHRRALGHLPGGLAAADEVEFGCGGHRCSGGAGAAVWGQIVDSALLTEYLPGGAGMGPSAP